MALGLLLVLGAAAEAQALRKGDQVAGSATVVDGQSFDIKSDRFKLWGVDTPDRNTGCYRNGRRWRPTADARSAMHRCVDGKKMCSSQMMAIDAAGGAGKGGVAGTMRSAWRDAEGTSRERTVVAALCTPTNLLGLPVEVETAAAKN